MALHGYELWFPSNDNLAEKPAQRMYGSCRILYTRLFASVTEPVPACLPLANEICRGSFILLRFAFVMIRL
jgi:hypothetical protein